MKKDRSKMFLTLILSYQMIQTGFEPVTVRLEGVCSIQLSYWTRVASFSKNLSGYTLTRDVSYQLLLIDLLYHKAARL